jgi:adenosine kinase
LQSSRTLAIVPFDDQTGAISDRSDGMKIFVSGSLAYDRIMDFPGRFEDHILPDKIHILNVCFMVNGLSEKFGGTAGNIAYNLSLLKEKPFILATVGKDFDTYRKWLDNLTLPLEGIVEIEEVFTAGAYITTDKADNQITGFNPGAMNYPSRFQFDGEDPSTTIAIVAPGNIEDMATYSQQYTALNIPYIFDPGQSIPALEAAQIVDMMNGASILISNDYELEMIVQKTGLAKTDILERVDYLITTLGEKGSLICSKDASITISAATAEEVADPTGAGDAYRAGIIKGLVTGKSIVEAAQMGSTCASFSVEKKGTQEHQFELEKFWQRYKMNFGKPSA